MEEEKNDKEKKALLLRQNTLEKLIKLDQKNSSLSPFKHKNRRRLLIRDQALNSDFSWTPNQLEQGLYIFWNHVDQYYFKNVKEDDTEQIDLLIESLEIVAKDLSVKYAGFEAYEAFKKIVSQKFKKMLLTEALAKTNFQNLKKKYYISSKKLQKTIKSSKGGAEQQNFAYDVNSLKAAKKKDRVNGFLTEEARQLDSFLQKTEEKSTKPSPLDAEIEKLTKEYKRMNEANSDKLVRLKSKATKQKTTVDINEIINPDSAHHEGGRSSLSTKRGGNSNNNKMADLKNVMVSYLKKLIVRLENQQAAESIKYVIDCKKPEKAGGQYQFCVIFDEALSHNECWVNESNLDQLDKLREQSLFKPYKIPQKIYHSVNSANLPAFHACDQQVMNHAATLKEKPWKDLMKKGFLEGTKGFNKEDLFMKSKEFGLCHHCKYLFPGEFLIKCTYRTSELKPPTISSEYLNPVATHGRIPKRSMWNNRLSVSSFYQKKNGELICSRSFCRLCLKQNFDMKSADVVHKPNWICPFCDGVCNCSRCLRHDHINKLMSLYSILGGKLDSIKEESYLERYIQNSIPFDPKQHPARKSNYFALKPTRGNSNKTEKQVSDVKGKVNMFKDNIEQYQSLKDLRVTLERVRILCSQVSKRENTKTKLEALNNKITNKNLDTGKKLVITPGPKARRAPITDIEPPVIKKRKRGRPPKVAPPESDSDEIEEEEDDDDVDEENDEDSQEDGEEDEEDEESFSEEEEEEEEDESFLKKKLGRKKKQIVRSNKAKASKYIKATKAHNESPRKRGRPRKYPLPEEVEEAEEDLYSPDEYDDEEVGEEEEEEEGEYDEEEGSEENESYSSSNEEELEDDEENSEDQNSEEGSEVENNSFAESESESEQEEDPRWKDRNKKAKQIQDKIQEMRKLNKGKPRRGRPPKISNPNEPGDFDEDEVSQNPTKKPYRLKKELQKILIHQNVNQFEVFARTPNSKRATRSSSSKPKNRNRKIR